MFVKNFGEGYLEGYLVSSEMLPEAFRMFARHHQDDDGCTKKISFLGAPN